MARTGRTPGRVMDDALHGMRQAGWTGRTGADADHLKTPEDVDATAAVGFTFFTIDPSDHVDAHADDYDEPTLRDEVRRRRGRGRLARRLPRASRSSSRPGRPSCSTSRPACGRRSSTAGR